MDLNFKNLRLAGYDTDMYELNPMGVLRSCKSGRILKWSPVKRKTKDGIVDTGYLGFRLHITGKPSIRCHRLLAILFIPNPLCLPMVDHIDGDPKNNSIDNLRWVTRQQNTCNRKSNGESGFKNIIKKLYYNKYYWNVRIMFHGKQVVDELFQYNNEEEPPAEVIAFRNVELRKWHGKHARI